MKKAARITLSAAPLTKDPNRNLITTPYYELILLTKKTLTKINKKSFYAPYNL
jgi:hypothetical protein